MKKLILRETGGSGARYVLFCEVPTFDDFDRICRPTPELATAPWQRAGYPTSAYSKGGDAMTYDAKLTRARDLIAKRDEIDAQLSELLGAEPRRGRPRKTRLGGAETTNPEPLTEA